MYIEDPFEDRFVRFISSRKLFPKINCAGEED